MKPLGGKTSINAIRLAIASSPFEQGLRASESGLHKAVAICVCCEKREAEEGSLYCGEFCRAYAELTAELAQVGEDDDPEKT